MKFMKSNPQTLLLVNPGSPPKRKKAKRKIKETKKMARRNPPKRGKKKATRRRRASAPVTQRDLMAQLAAAELQLAAPARKKAGRGAKGYNKVAKGLGWPVADVRARFSSVKEAQAFLKEERAAGRAAAAVSSAEAKALREYRKGARKAGKGFAQIARKIKRFEKASEDLGVPAADLARRFDTVKAARAALGPKTKRRGTYFKPLTAKQRKAVRKKAKSSLSQTRKSWAPLAKQLSALTRESWTPKRMKDTFGKLKDARAYVNRVRVQTGMVSGVKPSEMTGYAAAMMKKPRQPSSPPSDFYRDIPHLAVGHLWRPEIQGKSTPGWYWTPPVSRGGKYTYRANPRKRRKARKKQSAIIKMTRKLPLVGKPLAKGMTSVGKMFKGKKGKKNPAFSLGEIAKITIAGGVGYVGGCYVNNFASGLAERVGLSGTGADLAGGAATIGATHMLLKDSDYYVPVMTGVGIATVKKVMEGREYVEGEEAGFFGGLWGKVSGLLDSGKEAMGYVPSDDDLLSSIDADLGEYVDVDPMGEYVDVDPMGEYVDIPMEEYVDVDPMGEDEIAMSEYVDIPMEEYVDVDPTSDLHGLSEYVEIDPLGDDSWNESDDTLNSYEELADEDLDTAVVALSGEYGDGADIGYGQLHPAEEVDMGSYEELADDDEEYGDELADYEELAEAYEGLADDYVAADGMGYTKIQPAAVRRLRQRAKQLRRYRGRKGRVPRVLRQRAAIISSRGRGAWLRKLGQGGKGSQVARRFRKKVQRAVVRATVDTPGRTGSKAHFRASYANFAQGQRRISAGMKRAFLVAYRASTRGPKAALVAAHNAGVPGAAAAALAKAPAPSIAAVARGEQAPGQITRSRGGHLVRKVANRMPRVKRVRRAGQGGARFGGIFRDSIFGKRGRWRNY